MAEREQVFEEEVLRVSRALFGKTAPYQGASFLDSHDNRERDGVFIGEDAVVLIEATVSRRLDKAQKDGKKLADACISEARKHPFKAIRGYFVTLFEPTADQRQFIAQLNAPVVACSFAQLRSMLVDAREYLNLRAGYAFGSARNPLSGSATDLGPYVPMRLAVAGSNVGRAYAIDELADQLQAGETTVLLGDFGAGKSMTLRQVHESLRERYLRDASSLQFPLTLNLRDHQGQRDPDEAIRRHANKVGFDSPTQLVRAWRAGEIHLILDGFDEIATSTWLGQAADLRMLRRRSVELIRRFADETPDGSGILISGRRHFFDDRDEMLVSLGLRDRRPLIVATDEFSSQQIQDYLRLLGWDGQLPSWMPTRPLLLGYLVGSGTVSAMRDAPEIYSPAAGWDMLLNKVCDREATIEVGVDGGTIRRVLERLATVARTRVAGTGPIQPSDLAECFASVCGSPPDYGSYQLLQRMPGLGAQDPNDGSRHFIDVEFADAARAGDIASYIISAGGESTIETFQGTVAPLGDLGVSLASHMAARMGVAPPRAFAMADRLYKRNANHAFVFDCLRTGLELGGAGSEVRMTLESLTVDTLTFGVADHDLSGLRFNDCIIDVLDVVEYDGESPLPTFQNCAFISVLGAASLAGLPTGKFIECTFDAFDPSLRTTKGLLALGGLTSRQRVALTILKKIYLQRGAARQEGALSRGLDDSHKAHVGPVLEILVSHGMISRGKAGGTVMYHSIRGLTPRVRTMIEKGSASEDAILSIVA